LMILRHYAIITSLITPHYYRQLTAYATDRYWLTLHATDLHWH
jgi:hypothetical protein